MEKARIDKYLWCIRLFKTRTAATAACDAGKVRLNGSAAKPSRTVQLGDTCETRTEGRKWVIRILQLVDRRLPYKEATRCYEDLTPEEEKSPVRQQAASFFTGKRRSKVGRPTKKQRRDLEDFTSPEPET